MAQDIDLLGAVYPDVPAVQLPKDGGGTATFTDVSDTTAAASDVAQGKQFYTAAGVLTQGTASGGGGEVDPPNDGKTHLFIRVPYAGYTYAPLLTRTSGTMAIDWGDGTTQSASASNPTHTYSAAGEYEIVMEVSAGGSWAVASGGFGATSQSWITSIATATNRTIFWRATVMNRAYLYDEQLKIGLYAFRTCLALRKIVISYDFTVGHMGGYFAGFCHPLTSLVLPATLTAIPDNMLYSSGSIAEVEIPQAVTSIGSSAFYNCISLGNIDIPSAVSSIAASAFSGCHSLETIHFRPTTPPTVANSNAWSSLPTTCKIYVPTGTLAAYTSAANYPAPATYTYIEE